MTGVKVYAGADRFGFTTWAVDGQASLHELANIARRSTLLVHWQGASYRVSSLSLLHRAGFAVVVDRESGPFRVARIPLDEPLDFVLNTYDEAWERKYGLSNATTGGGA